MFRAFSVAVLAALVLAPSGPAHAPTTAIGRAVEAFQEVAVSYHPGSVVSDIAAGGFPHVVGTNPRVAFMPASAVSEIAGGPNAIAQEIAREARLDGTLVVLVGTELGAWSNDIGEARLAELVTAARTTKTGTSPAAIVESLVRSMQSEPVDSGPPWGWTGSRYSVAQWRCSSLSARSSDEHDELGLVPRLAHPSTAPAESELLPTSQRGTEIVALSGYRARFTLDGLPSDLKETPCR